MSEWDWREHAACIGHPHEWWYPTPKHPGRKGHPPGHDPYQQARTICNTCPVRWPCLTYANQNHETEGMWGGLEPIERSGQDPRADPAHRKTA
jgi:WhiB family redox-sensing transcriptional regulator